MKRESFKLGSMKLVRILLLLFIYLTLLIALIRAFYTGEWQILFIVVITFVLTAIPYIFERGYKIDLPIEFELTILIFIYAAMFLGEVQDFYFIFWWWDLLLHGISAIALGFVGFFILFILYKGRKIDAKPFTIAVFSFSFALAMGVLWEIFEFVIDTFFGLNMLKSGLLDTMGDLIIDTLGALIASIIGFIYLKRGKVLFFEKIIEEFVHDNPLLFRVELKRKNEI